MEQLRAQSRLRTGWALSDLAASKLYGHFSLTLLLVKKQVKNMLKLFTFKQASLYPGEG